LGSKTCLFLVCFILILAMSQSFPLKLPDVAATFALGCELGEAAQAGEVIALVGDLGAGKTTLTQGILKGLDYHDEVTSPTFSLVQEYRGGRLEVFHFDFYRVEDEHELLDLGWDDYLDRDGLVIVEWPALHPDLLPKNTRWLKLSHLEVGRLVEEMFVCSMLLRFLRHHPIGTRRFLNQSLPLLINLTWSQLRV